jgi:hypothetical protein
MLAELKVDMCDASLAEPTTLNPLPRLAVHLRLRHDAMFRNLSIDTADPHLIILLMETEEPRVWKLMTDRLLLKREQLLMDTDEPKLTESRTEQP